MLTSLLTSMHAATLLFLVVLFLTLRSTVVYSSAVLRCTSQYYYLRSRRTVNSTTLSSNGCLLFRRTVRRTPEPSGLCHALHRAVLLPRSTPTLMHLYHLPYLYRYHYRHLSSLSSCLLRIRFHTSIAFPQHSIQRPQPSAPVDTHPSLVT